MAWYTIFTAILTLGAPVERCFLEAGDICVYNGQLDWTVEKSDRNIHYRVSRRNWDTEGITIIQNGVCSFSAATTYRLDARNTSESSLQVMEENKICITIVFHGLNEYSSMMTGIKLKRSSGGHIYFHEILSRDDQRRALQTLKD